MKLIYANHPPLEPGHKSIFLVGPTPRSSDVPSWRPRAIEILKEYNFDGRVLIPETESGEAFPYYYDQVEWEHEGLHNCESIVAWVPREMSTMPALTTNVEFGYWMGREPHKVLYGRPNGSIHTEYLDWMYEKNTGRRPINTLEELLGTAVDLLG
jgi:hypothetical protein